MNINEALRKTVEDSVAAEGYELVHMELKGGIGRPILRLYIDRPGGITLDDCQHVSRQISTLLDVEDPIPHKYILEVSSPGLDRRLYREADYIRFVGRKVRLTLHRPAEGQRRYRGTLVDAGNGRIRISDAERPDRCFEFEVEAIEKANLEIEL